MTTPCRLNIEKTDAARIFTAPRTATLPEGTAA